MSETHENIDIFIHRSPHTTAQDFDFFHDELRQPEFHVYAPESAGLDRHFQRGLEKIAKGDGKVYQEVMSRTNPDSMWGATFRGLFMSRKPIHLFDATEQQIAADPVLSSFGEYTQTPSSAAQVVQETRSHLLRGALYLAKRDTIIANNIEQWLPGVIGAHPRLRTLGTVGLYMTIGDNHQLVDQILMERGFRVHTNKDVILGPREAATNKYLMKQEPDESEILRAAAMPFIRSFVAHKSTNKLRQILNDGLSDFQFDHLSDLLDEVRTNDLVAIHEYLGWLLTDNSIEESGLEFVDPSSQKPDIALKQSIEVRNGITGIRTGIF